MPDKKSIIPRCIGIFLLGGFLFSYPVLTIFNREARVFGIPLLFFYIFFAWFILIAFILLCEKFPERHPLSETDTGTDGINPSG
jgi:hypothetical protein